VRLPLQVWVTASLDVHGRVQYQGTKGLCAVLVEALSGLTPAEVLEVRRMAQPGEEGREGAGVDAWVVPRASEELLQAELLPQHLRVTRHMQ
jgi:hypothetical protein